MGDRIFSHNNMILTGIPRSGTTLTCHLLNRVPDTIALHEPIPLPMLDLSASRKEICFRIGDFFCESRHFLNRYGTAMSKQRNGRIPDNPKGGYPGVLSKLMARLIPFKKQGRLDLRKSRVTRGPVHFKKRLSHEFLLCIHHNAGFTVLLDDLTDYFPCFAVVRNPLSVLASWNSIDFPIRSGHSPAAERIDAVLKRDLTLISDRYERQLHMLSWFFEKYDSALPRDHVIYYEDIILSRGKALKIFFGAAGNFDEDFNTMRLKNKNLNKLYNRDLMLKLGEKLLKTEGAFWKFYTRASVEQLMMKID